MTNRIILVVFALFFTVHLPAQEKIPADRDGLLSGGGMGLAAAAERNGFPGPKHVLELKEQLKLTPEQIETAEILFENVIVEAKALGKEIVEKEEEVHALFKTGSVTDDVLKTKLLGIGKLRADLRRVHLQAHLRMKESLRPEQIKQYSNLRGYETEK